MIKHDHHHAGCTSGSCCGARRPEVTRRQFFAGAGVATLGSTLLHQLGRQSVAAAAPSQHRPPANRPLRVLPVLAYEMPSYREATSWRNWGGLITEAHVGQEGARIRNELDAMAAKADFPLEVMPLAAARNTEEAQSIANGEQDVTLIYGAGGGTGLIIALANPEKHNLMFVRHRTGPAYLWYEIVHPRFLRRETDEFQHTGGMTINDVVVDDHDEVLWRLRALNGLRGIQGKRVVAIGGALGWDRGHHSDAPNRARELWGMDFAEISYEEMSERIQRATSNEALVRRCIEQSRAYLEQPGVTLLPLQQQLTTEELVAGKGSAQTLDEMRAFVDKAFVLTEVFRELMAEHETDAITVGHCMGSIIPMSETTACLVLTLLNDEGYLAFCESDFVVIPSGILLHYICGKPVFFCNPTYPHSGVVTVAHCSAPRKMDGKNLEDVLIRTHFESDYGAAPKVEFRVGQEMTVLVPDFGSQRWVGFEGEVLENPAHDICTSQVDLRIKGDHQQLVEEMRGFHWMTCYGDYRREVGYALAKAGVGWLDISGEA